MRIELPHFEPDKSKFNPSAGTAVNCLPVADGWGPMRKLVPLSDPLPGEPIAASFAINSKGNTRVYSATETDLYELNLSTSPYSWEKVGGSYPNTNRWKFTQFGDQLIAHYQNIVPEVVDLVAGGNFSELTGAPKAKTSWVAGDFLVFGALQNDGSAIAWSGINDASFWDYGSRGSDTQTFPNGGEIVDGIPGTSGAIILQRSAIRAMDFAPASGYSFTTRVLNDNRGAVDGVAVIGTNEFVYRSQDGFFKDADGKAIGAERVDRWFASQSNETEAIVDPFNKIVWWFYKGANGLSLGLGWDWVLDRWCQSDQVIKSAASLATPGVTWDGLQNLYDTIDDVDVPFDSSLFKESSPILGAFDEQNRFSLMSGTNLAVQIESNQAGIDNAHSMINGGRLIGDAKNFTVTPFSANFHGGDLTAKNPVTPTARTGNLSFRTNGRLHKFRLNIDEGESWSILEAFDLQVTGAGES